MDIQTRARNILTNPQREWPVIAGESADVASLIRDYAGPLSAIPVIARWLAVVLMFHGSFLRGAVNGVVGWVFGLVGVWLAAIVIERLAPSFASRGNTIQAMKLVVYASTPVWVAGVLNLVPELGPLILIAALYAIYLFYLGLPVLMHTPDAQVVPFMLVSALVVILLTIVVGACAAAIAGV